MTSFFGHVIIFFSKKFFNFFWKNVSKVDRVKEMFCSLYNNKKTPLFNKVAQQIGEKQEPQDADKYFLYNCQNNEN